MKWLIYLLFVALVPVSLTYGMKQVVSHQKEKPEIVVEEYLNAVISNDYQTAYTFISDTNTEMREWLEFLHFITSVAPRKLVSTIHLAHSITKHQIVQTDFTSSETAIVHVESVVPDMERIVEMTQSEDEIKSLFESGNLPLKQKQGTFILGMVNSIWKINELEGVSGDSVSQLAMNLADKLLGKEAGLKLDNEIRAYQNKKRN